MDVTKPYTFTGAGAMDVTRPYNVTGFGAKVPAMPATPFSAGPERPGRAERAGESGRVEAPSLLHKHEPALDAWGLRELS